MARRFIYIINPISGTRTKKDLQSVIEQQTKAKGFSFEIFPSVASGDYSFLHSIIKEQKITDVVIAGGDGTVNQVVNSLLNCGVNFGIIPCGSGNGLANTAKIPKNPAKALDIIFNGKASPIDGFYINNRFACMLCGIGFDAKVAYDFANSDKRGLSSYIKHIARNFFSALAYPFEIKINDTTFEIDALLICIANSNQFGNNFTIAPKASLNDGLLDIVIISKQNKLSALIQTFKQVFGKNPLQISLIEKNKKVIYFQTSAITITNRGNAPLHIDGDIADTFSEINISISKNRFFLLQGISSSTL